MIKFDDTAKVWEVWSADNVWLGAYDSFACARAAFCASQKTLEEIEAENAD